MTRLTAKELIKFLDTLPEETVIQIMDKHYAYKKPTNVYIEELTYTTNFKDEHYLCIGNK